MKKMNLNLFLGICIVGLLFIMMIVSLFWTPYDPNHIYKEAVLQAPSSEFTLGTDYLGRDLLSRIMYASQTAFLVGSATLLFSGIIGVSIGLFSGFFGGKLDEVLMRIIDMLITIPSTIMVLVFIATFGSGMIQTIVAISFTGISKFAKMTRARVLSIKESNYIEWANSVGIKKTRILFFHIAPELTPTLLIIGALEFSGAIMTEAALSYLGLGVKAPNASWGNILSRSQSYLLTNPLYALIPGLLISFTVIGFNLISDGLSKVFVEKE